MGKGDRKSRKAKIWMGSYGNTRPRKKKKTISVAKPKAAKPKKAAPKKKATTKKAKAEE